MGGFISKSEGSMPSLDTDQWRLPLYSYPQPEQEITEAALAVVLFHSLRQQQSRRPRFSSSFSIIPTSSSMAVPTKSSAGPAENMDQKIIRKSLEVVQQKKEHLLPPVHPDVLHFFSSISSLVEIPSRKLDKRQAAQGIPDASTMESVAPDQMVVNAVFLDVCGDVCPLTCYTFFENSWQQSITSCEEEKQRRRESADVRRGHAQRVHSAHADRARKFADEAAERAQLTEKAQLAKAQAGGQAKSDADSAPESKAETPAPEPKAETPAPESEADKQRDAEIAQLEAEAKAADAVDDVDAATAARLNTDEEVMQVRPQELHVVEPRDPNQAKETRASSCASPSRHAAAIASPLPCSQKLQCSLHALTQINDKTFREEFTQFADIGKEAIRNVTIARSPATERNAVTGIGIYLMQKKGDPEPYYIISALTPAGAAEKSGQIKVGQVLLAVNNVAVRDKDVKDVKQMILGQGGTSVTLSLSSPPDAPDKLRTLKQACRMHQEATIEKIK